MQTFPRAGSSVGARCCIASGLVGPPSLQQSAPHWRRHSQNRNPPINVVEIGTTPAIETDVPHHRAACIYGVRSHQRGRLSADAQVRLWRQSALTSSAFAQLQANPSLGRAEALRRSMLALMDKGGRHVHPAYWAPFVVVGEGATTNAAPGSPLVTSAVPPIAGGKSLQQRGERAKRSKGTDWRGEVWRQ